MSAPAPKPFSLQAPERIAMEYGGNKQKIAQAVQSGLVDPTSGLLAGMFIDRMRAAQIQEQAPHQTVAQQVLGPQGPQGGPPPPGGPQGGPPPGGPPPQGAPQGGPPPPPPPQGGPPPQGPVGMAEGGLTSLPVPDYMFDEQTFAGGGIVAFAKGDKVEADARARAKRQAEAYLGKPISDEDFDMLVKATYAESSIRSNLAENAMISGSILNRARTLGSIPEALNVKNAFQSVTGKPGEREPSDRFVQGPGKKRADTIFSAMDALPRVPREQKDFTSALPGAYTKGTKISYLEEMKKSPTAQRYGDSQFRTMLMAPPTQMARNEPPAPALQRVAQSVLPGTPSAQAQTSALTPSRADRALSALNAINPIGTAQAAETNKPQAAPKGPYPDVMKNPEYNPMVEPTIMPSTIDPGRKLSNAEVLKRAAGSLVGAGVVNYFGGLGNLAMTPHKAIAAGVNATDRFLNMPRGYNDVPPEAPRTPGKLTGPNNYSRENDPMLKRMLGGNTPAPVAAPVAAPVMAAGPAKETAEEAMARILAANKKENFWNMISQAGFGMMAGTSPNALTNIGAGFAGALPGLATANKSDRETALKQQELAQQRDMNEKQLAAQTPAALQYARSQVNLFKSKTPNPTASQIEEVFSKALVDYPVSIQKTTGQMTANQANVLAQNAATLGNIPRGPDGKKMTQDQYAQQLMLQYGSGGLGNVDFSQFTVTPQ